ncbi:GrpB family protein [Streptomyces triticagri]|uniref:GrpB family protein n=1 Tax=Streptomyces triticagri TaxID=2293568 RepID=A0A372LZQ0_9ACTN|nr:GrpB family protein [Streptomyces triticagri]RFU84156.1 GrpB family protein [Streptomyces triticagri]
MTPDEIEAAHVGSAPRLDGPVTLREYDPRWPDLFAQEAAAISSRLSGLDHRVEHVGSTSVPELPAKPVIDMLLTVPDPADEPSYTPVLAPLGYELVIREPGWYEHRVLRKYLHHAAADQVNLHVLPSGCEEADRMTRFRDRLRADAGDHALYADTKRALSGRSWEFVQNYADAKSEVVEEILRRA